MNSLDLVGLTPLCERSSGRPDVVIGLIDGPVATGHSALDGRHIREIAARGSGGCARLDSAACAHGTFIAGVLSAKRGTPAPAICPECTLLLRPVFFETEAADGRPPAATPLELAAAITDCIEAGARCINLSLGLSQPTFRAERELEEVLTQAAARGVIVVAAAGNQGALGSTSITRHGWVIPVAGCDAVGAPTGDSNLGTTVGRRGLRAPGDAVTSLGADGTLCRHGGTSVATAFVTGAVGLLWSIFPGARAADVKFAVTRASPLRRKSVVPPLLDAWAAYQSMSWLAFTGRRE